MGDISQGATAVPGCLAASVFDEPWNIEEGISFEAPLVYYFGYTNPGDAPEHFRVLVKQLASVLNGSSITSTSASSAGMYVDTMGWVEGAGLEYLLHQIEAFSCD